MSVGELLGSTISKMTNTSVSCLPFLGGWFQIYFHFHLGKFSLVGSFAASWSFGCNLRGLENFEAILETFGLNTLKQYLKLFARMKHDLRCLLCKIQIHCKAGDLASMRNHLKVICSPFWRFLISFFCFVCFDCLFSIVAGGAWHGALRGRVDAAPLPDQQEGARHHHQDPHIQVRLLSRW